MIKIYQQKLKAEVEKPIKLALLGDLHLKKSDGLVVDEIIKILNTNSADMICLIGDFIEEDEALPFLSNLRKLNNKNVFAVLGNHDYGLNIPQQKPNHQKAEKILRVLTGAGIQVLRNRIVRLVINNQKIKLAGIKDLWVKRPKRSIEKVTILLSHNPDVIYQEIASSASIILSGHTHGGSIKYFPAFTRVLNSRVGAINPKGLFSYNGRRVFITSGIGKLMGLIRIGIDPEIVFLTLEKS